MSVNVLRKFKALKVRQQFLLLILLSSTVPAAIVGLLGSVSAGENLSNKARSLVQRESMESIEETEAFLDNIDNDVTFLSQVPSIQGVIRARDNDGTDPIDNASYDEWVNQLQLVFSGIIKTKEYHRLEYLDEAGNALVVVETDAHSHDHDDDDDHEHDEDSNELDGADENEADDDDEVEEKEAAEKEVNVLLVDQVENQADRPYFTETTALSPGELYVSSMQLHRHEGEIKEPYEPVIKYATPVVNEAGQNRGIILATVFTDSVLDELNEEEGQFEDEKATLVNADGYYLAHPDPEKRWGFELGQETTLAQDFSEEVAAQLLGGGAGLLQLDTYVLAYDTLQVGSDPSSNLIAVTKVPVKSVLASVTAFRRSAALAVLISLGVVLPLAIFRGRQLISLLEELATDISVSSQQMASTVSEQERIASQQAASVNETTTTMDELEASSRHAAGQANAAVDAAKHAFSASEDGAQAVGEALEGMFTLEAKVDAIAEKIVHLSGQASQISNVSQLVIDFANQTNMLALNSSVEAIRAGEHGKGFALVANEIRKLADQSQQSADKINTLVSSIQKSINETVMVTEEGTKTVKTGVQIAKRTEATFNEIQDSVSQVVLNNQQVSLNLKQQVDAIKQVVDAMEIINRGTSETATGLNHTKEGTERLNEAALILKKAV
ncbi:methyl-accepting chemotaxis protein [Leptolyngbya cf. ectocarpi LEGE 11479]|uniref:Methyl-accepting chemotaxis protein n=1 Tax=Leptolyngbya cf. ectocarpi LEGE 11479 TaxID=1828722 RepID=A0A928ZRZ6_LEPEC|nr:methyl-accepting chemotaxis protein [Leptolyngbya ectocarpi]MBE9067288.1 methyl-accepting chemotaxis protein [Leptolyngbya cf. ectocarpi LEGE 11479]